VKGSTAYGISLYVAPPPRFQRIKHVADRVAEKVEGLPSSYMENFESKLNDNYECEGIEIELDVDDSGIKISVKDIYGGRRVIHSD